MKSGTFRNWPIARKLNTVLLLVTTVLFVLVAAAFLVAWVSSARR